MQTRSKPETAGRDADHEDSISDLELSSCGSPSPDPSPRQTRGLKLKSQSISQSQDRSATTSRVKTVKTPRSKPARSPSSLSSFSASSISSDPSPAKQTTARRSRCPAATSTSASVGCNAVVSESRGRRSRRRDPKNDLSENEKIQTQPEPATETPIPSVARKAGRPRIHPIESQPATSKSPLGNGLKKRKISRETAVDASPSEKSPLKFSRTRSGARLGVPRKPAAALARKRRRSSGKAGLADGETGSGSSTTSLKRRLRNATTGILTEAMKRKRNPDTLTARKVTPLTVGRSVKPSRKISIDKTSAGQDQPSVTGDSAATTRGSSLEASKPAPKERCYHVKEIMGYRVEDGLSQMKVHWRGYGHKDDTWEPLENLWAALQEVSDYLETIGKELLIKGKRMVIIDSTLEKTPEKREEVAVAKENDLPLTERSESQKSVCSNVSLQGTLDGRSSFTSEIAVSTETPGPSRAVAPEHDFARAEKLAAPLADFESTDGISTHDGDEVDKASEDLAVCDDELLNLVENSLPLRSSAPNSGTTLAEAPPAPEVPDNVLLDQLEVSLSLRPGTPRNVRFSPEVEVVKPTIPLSAKDLPNPEPQRVETVNVTSWTGPIISQPESPSRRPGLAGQTSSEPIEPQNTTKNRSVIPSPTRSPTPSVPVRVISPVRLSKPTPSVVSPSRSPSTTVIPHSTAPPALSPTKIPEKAPIPCQTGTTPLKSVILPDSASPARFPVKEPEKPAEITPRYPFRRKTPLPTEMSLSPSKTVSNSLSNAKSSEIVISSLEVTPKSPSRVSPAKTSLDGPQAMDLSNFESEETISSLPGPKGGSMSALVDESLISGSSGGSASKSTVQPEVVLRPISRVEKRSESPEIPSKPPSRVSLMNTDQENSETEPRAASESRQTFAAGGQGVLRVSGATAVTLNMKKLTACLAEIGSSAKPRVIGKAAGRTVDLDYDVSSSDESHGTSGGLEWNHVDSDPLEDEDAGGGEMDVEEEDGLPIAPVASPAIPHYEIKSHVEMPRVKSTPSTWIYNVLMKTAPVDAGTYQTLSFAQCSETCFDELKSYLQQTAASLSEKVTDMERRQAADAAQRQQISGAVDAMALLCQDDEGFAVVQQMIKKRGQEQEELLRDPRLRDILMRIMTKNTNRAGARKH